METSKINKTNNTLLNLNTGILVLFCIALYGFAIFQDYIFSKVKLTGFYWSDTMLYNIYWLFFIPFIKIAQSLYNKFKPKSLTNKLLYALSTGIIFSVMHVLVFTSIFILGSHLIYDVPHRYSTILKNALSNQLHITVITYLVSSFVFDYLNKNKPVRSQKISNTIILKNGTRRIRLDVSTIQLIKANRPYTMIYAKGQKFLHDESLKKIEKLLDAQVFLRVHRSAIVNKNYIEELKSRKNGDYDGILTNGESLRFSRHYRRNWNEILNH